MKASWFFPLPPPSPHPPPSHLYYHCLSRFMLAPKADVVATACYIRASCHLTAWKTTGGEVVCMSTPSTVMKYMPLKVDSRAVRVRENYSATSSFRKKLLHLAELSFALKDEAHAHRIQRSRSSSMSVLAHRSFWCYAFFSSLDRNPNWPRAFWRREGVSAALTSIAECHRQLLNDFFFNDMLYVG